MAFEVISYALSATPNRVYAMLKLIEELQSSSPSVDLVYSLLQPDSINKNKESAESVYGILQNLGMVSLSQDTEKTVRLVDDSFLHSFDDFRTKMQQSLLGAIKPEENNYLLTQFTAWYAVYNQRVLSLRREDLERKFHEDLYPSIIASKSTRKINDTALLSWGLWARFLGFGREYAFARGQRTLLPNAYVRVNTLLPSLLPLDGSELPIQTFLDNLSSYCPELDGGLVFNRVYESVYAQSSTQTHLSLMLSSALNTLHINGIIELIDRADALNTRQLFPSQSYQNRVSHLRFRQEITTA
ncbi:MAG: hypothetical protein H6673_12160 [Anaerolineales bacterium]|nr:hypothetical protein [Anaerolineales bacterium]